VSAGDFDAWAAGIRKVPDALDRTAYLKLEQPSEKEPVRHFASVDPALFDAAVNLCVRPGKMCVNQMMAIDAEGGTGRAGQFNLPR
jgi:cytochrome o ubiquinol oxidase subunit 2